MASAACGAALVAGLSTGAAAATLAQSRREAPAHAPRSRHAKARSVDRRVSALAKALHLDARQQIELKRVLISQQAEVRRVWSDSTVAAAERVAATRAIENATSGRIRGLLNTEQKAKYNPPRPANEPAAARPDVEGWMSKTRPR